MRRERRKQLKELREGLFHGPELKSAQEAAEKFIQSHEVFFNPPPTKDAELNARLASLGNFTGDTDSDPCDLEWETPDGFCGPWGEFSLALSYPPGKNKALGRLITAAQRVVPKLPELSAMWFREVIDNFRNVYVGQLNEESLAKFERDAAGVITEESLRKQAGKGQIQLHHEDGDFFAQIWFPISWDEEHGYEIEWDDQFLKELLAKS